MINLSEYTYDLPDERIARFPVEPRHDSKLLVYQQGQIGHHQFKEIGDFLPQNPLLVFNNSKVIPARIIFQKPSGTLIEVFLLHPIAPTSVINIVMESTTSCVWACMIGNKKRWKTIAATSDTASADTYEKLAINIESAPDTKGILLGATLVNAEQNYVQFDWQSLTDQPVTFAEVVQKAGQIPLPPYLKRETLSADLKTYQTIYAKQEGAVAAPTAGLHFTDQVLQSLINQGVKQDFLTLHVGAGTFQPIKVENVIEHRMHCEQVVFGVKNIEVLLQNLGNTIPVGTTSMRALESLYWLGVDLLQRGTWNRSNDDAHHFFVEKLFAYQQDLALLPSSQQALEAVLAQMQADGLQEIVGETEIFIFPGYVFKICKGIITNFHQPDSTLILLVAALLGNDWKKVYQTALAKDYRFLSYGDSSLLLP